MILRSGKTSLVESQMEDSLLSQAGNIVLHKLESFMTTCDRDSKRYRERTAEQKGLLRPSAQFPKMRQTHWVYKRKRVFPELQEDLMVG